MSAPSFYLPPCPACSSRVCIVRPFWHHARHSRAARGKPCLIWTGCSHASDLIPNTVREEPADWQAVEDAWEHAAGVMFDTLTATWTEEERERFRKELADKPPELPGQTLLGAMAAVPKQEFADTF